MKKILLLLIISSLSLVAFEYPFDVERLNVHFNGICNNQSSIIAYGTGCMILRTTDEGSTWEQIKVAHDSLEIQKIINLNEDYYGILTDNYLIRSTDNGKTWRKVKINEHNIYDINSNIDNIYLLSDNQVLVYDLDLNFTETLNIEYNNSKKKFILSNNNILIPQDTGKLIIYDINLKKQTQIIDLRNLGLCTQCIEPYNLSVSGNNVYFTIDSDSGNVIKSTNNGFNWKKIPHKTNGVGKAIGEDYYYIYTSGFGTSPLVQPVFKKIDSLNQNKLIGQNSLDRIVLIEDVLFSDFVKTSLNTFFAVGRNKSILKSTNGGVNWSVVCHLASADNLYCVNDTLDYNYTYNGIVSKTTNQGITWLPQKSYPKAIKQITVFDLAYFDSLGNGFVYQSYAFSTEYNFMVTKDFGETFEYKDIDNLRMNFKDNVYKSKLIKNESGITILNNMGIGKNRYTTIYQMDDNFNYIGYSFLDSIVICEIFQMDGPNYLAIGLERREPGPGQFDNDTFAIRQYWLMNSNDYGRSWTKDKSFGYPGQIGGSFRINEDVLFYTTTKNPIHDNYLDYSLNNINLKTKDINLYLFTDSMSYMSGFLKYEGLFLVNGYYNNFRNDNYPDKLTNWIKTERTPFNFANGYTGKQVSYLTGRYKAQPYLFKLIPKDSATVVNIETQTAFYANPPYPIPAMNYVSCQIFWDQRYDINNSVFKVYNIYGTVVSEGEGISLNKNNAYSGVLTWSPSSDLPVGTYYIKINHGDAVKVVPVILMR